MLAAQWLAKFQEEGFCSAGATLTRTTCDDDIASRRGLREAHSHQTAVMLRQVSFRENGAPKACPYRFTQGFARFQAQQYSWSDAGLTAGASDDHPGRGIGRYQYQRYFS